MHFLCVTNCYISPGLSCINIAPIPPVATKLLLLWESLRGNSLVILWNFLIYRSAGEHLQGFFYQRRHQIDNNSVIFIRVDNIIQFRKSYLKQNLCKHIAQFSLMICGSILNSFAASGAVHCIPKLVDNTLENELKE